MEPVDEIHYWLDAHSKGGRNGNRAKYFSGCMKEIRDDFKNVHNMSLSKLIELVEDTELVLDEVWKADLSEVTSPYPQYRMKNFMTIISNVLITRTKNILRGLDLWNGPFTRIRNTLNEGIKLCDKWAQTMDGLVRNHWMNYTNNRWIPETNHEDEENDEVVAFKYKPLSDFVLRLEDILRIRTTYEELKSILSLEEQGNLNIDTVFDVFDGTESLHCNVYTQRSWEEAVMRYEKRIFPIEKEIASKLSLIFQQTRKNGCKANPQTILRQLYHYQSLVTRPEISKLLASERENILSALITYVDQVDTEFEARRNQDLTNESGIIEGSNISATNSSPAIK